MSKSVIAAILVTLATLTATTGFAGIAHRNHWAASGSILAPVQKLDAADQASAGEGKILYYQDPMHPWYRSDKPGIAPDCGMKLVPIYASDAPAATLPPGGVEISPAHQQQMGSDERSGRIPKYHRPLHSRHRSSCHR